MSSDMLDTSSLQSQGCYQPSNTNATHISHCQGLLSVPLCHCLSLDASLSLNLNFFHGTKIMVPGHVPAPSSTALLLVPSTNVLGKRVLIGLYGADTRAKRGKIIFESV